MRNAKKHGWPVVYWVSKEYPNWYTSDQQPDYAIISEGQEHQVRVTAEQVVFTGGSFMFCLLRNVQMTLHGMLKHGDRRPSISFSRPRPSGWKISGAPVKSDRIQHR